jgi:DNA repair exonuclease SbcCD ATPase subunit
MDIQRNHTFEPKWATTEEITPKASLLQTALGESARSLDQIRNRTIHVAGVFSGYKIYSDEVYAVIDNKLYPLALGAQQDQKMEILTTANSMLALANSILQNPVPVPQVPVAPQAPLAAGVDYAQPLARPPSHAQRGRRHSRTQPSSRRRELTPVKQVSAENDRTISRLQGEIQRLNSNNFALSNKTRALTDALAKARSKLVSKNSVIKQLRHQLLQSQEELAESEANNKTLKLRLTDERKTNTDLKSTLQEAQDANTLLVSKLGSLSGEISEYKNIIQSLSEQLAREQETNKALIGTLSLKDNEINVVSTKNDQLEADLSSLRNQLRSLQSSLAKLESEKAAIQADLASSKDDNLVLSDKLQRNETLLGELRTQLTSTEDQVKATRDNLTTNERTIQALTEEKTILIAKIRENESENSRLNNELTYSRGSLLTLEATNAQLQTDALKVTELNKALEDSIRDKRSIEDYSRELHDRNSELEESIQRLRSENIQIKKDLESTKADSEKALALMSSLDEITQRLKSAEAEKSQLATSNTKLESLLIESKRQVDQKISEIAKIKVEMSSQIDEFEKAKSLLNTTITKQQDEILILKTQLRTLNTEVESLKNLKPKLQEAIQLNSALKSELELVQARAATQEKFEDYKTLTEKSIRDEAEIEKLRDQLQTSEAEKARFISNVKTILDSIQRASHILSNSSVMKTGDDINDLMTQAEAHVTDLLGFDKLYDELIDKIEKLANQTRTAESINEDLTSLIQICLSDCSIKDLESAIDRFKKTHPTHQNLEIFDELVSKKREKLKQTSKLMEFEMILSQLQRHSSSTVTIASLKTLVESYLTELGRRDDIGSENIKLSEALRNQKGKIQELSTELKRQKEAHNLHLQEEASLLELREQKLAEAETHLKHALRDLSKDREEMQELRSENEQLIRALATLNIDQRAFLSNPEKAVRDGIKTMRDANRSQREKIASLEESNHFLTSQINDLESMISDLKRQIESQEEDIFVAGELGTLLLDKNEKLTQSLEAKNSEFETLKATQNLTIQRLEAELEKNQRTIRAQEESIERTKLLLSGTLDECKTLTSQISTINHETEILRDENSLLRRQVSAINSSTDLQKESLQSIRDMSKQIFEQTN